MSCTNQFTINGLDMFAEYGFEPAEDANDTFLTIRERKEPHSNDWPEINGKEYDLTDTPKYEDREIVLSGYIKATSLAEFKTKFNALKTVFDNPGTVLLSCVDLGESVAVFYRKSTVKQITRAGANKIIVQIELQLQEVQTT